MSFDEQADGDVHGECAAEIHRLTQALKDIAFSSRTRVGMKELARHALGWAPHTKQGLDDTADSV